MSTEWDVWCVDCDVGMAAEVADYPEWRIAESMQAIIDNRNHLVALSDLVAHCAEVEVRVDFKRIDLPWLYKHVDHHLRPRNEYGDFWTERPD